MRGVKVTSIYFPYCSYVHYTLSALMSTRHSKSCSPPLFKPKVEVAYFTVNSFGRPMNPTNNKVQT